MSKNSYVNANLISTYDTFANWLTKTNQIIFDMGTSVVTTNSSAIPDVTTGNGYVNGFFGSNTLYVFSDLHGGTPTAKANLNISSNVVATSNVFISANLLVTGTANVTVNLNSVGIVSNNVSINNNLTVTNTAVLNTATAVVANIATANIVTLGVTGVGTAVNLNVTNIANLNNANVVSANITTLGVTGLSTLVNVSIGTGTSNVQANTTQLTIANPSATASVNATTFSGTAANATLLNSQNGAFYTNATNITTGTLPWTQHNPNTVNTSGNFVIAGTRTHNANVFVNTAVLSVGNATVNVTTNTTTIFVANGATNTSINPGVVTFGGGATINNTIYTGTANNANALGGYLANTTSPSDGFVLAYNLAENTIKWTNPSGISTSLSTNSVVANTQLQAGSNGSAFALTVSGNATSTNTVIRSNNVSIAVDSGNIQLNSNTLVSNSLLVSNTTANVIITTSQITIQNSTTSSVLTQNSFSRQANGATNLGPEGSGVNLSTLQSQITSNAAAAYTNAVANSANATNITSGTIGAGFLPATVVNTSGAFTVTGVITHNANLVMNTANQLLLGNATVNAIANQTSLAIFNGSSNVVVNASAINIGSGAATVNSTFFSRQANGAANLGPEGTGISLATLQGQITGNATAAYTNAVTIAANASNINTGTLGAGFLPATVVNTSASFTLAGAMVYDGTARFNANVGFNIAPGTSNSRFFIDFPTTTNSTDVLLVRKTRDSANSARYGFLDVGGLTTDTNGGAFWRGFHLQAPGITDGVAASVFPRFAISAETETLTNPSTRRWLLEAGNDSATSRYSIVMRTAGNDRLIIDSTGQVGIGGTPARALDVQGQQIRVLAGADNSGYEGFSAGTHLFSLTRVNNNLRISAYDGIQLWTNATTGVTGGAERMRIDSGGNVAIGWTTTSSGTLSVNGPETGNVAGNIGLIERLRTGTGNASGIDFVGVRNVNGTDWTTAGVRLQSFVDVTFQSYIQFNGNGLQHGMSFGTGSSTSDRNVVPERMRITQTGQVGIGTAGATPARTTISSSGVTNLNAPTLGASANASLFVTGADTSYGLVFGTNNSDGRTWLQAQRVDSATPYNITLNEAGGNVGIGLTTPAEMLDVQNNIRARGAGTGFAFIARQTPSTGWNAIISSGSTTTGYFASYTSAGTRIGFTGYWDTTAYFGAWTDSTTPIIFGTNGATRYTIQADGTNNFGTAVSAPYLTLRAQGGGEGGELILEKSPTGSSLSGTGVIIDTVDNRLRVFEAGGSFRGIMIDLTTCTSMETFATIGSNQTFTTKRINPRISSAADGSISPDISAADQYNRTALAAACTINAPVGSPVNGNKLMFRLRDNGTARALTWNGTYRAVGVTLPTTTTASKTTYVGCVFNSDENFWDVIAVSTQA